MRADSSLYNIFFTSSQLPGSFSQEIILPTGTNKIASGGCVQTYLNLSSTISVSLRSNSNVSPMYYSTVVTFATIFF